MSDAAGQDTEAFQFLPGQRLFLGALDVGDVGAGADIAGEGAVGFEARNSRGEHPSILAIGTLQAAFLLVAVTGVEGRTVIGAAIFTVVRMDLQGPTGTEGLFHGAAGKVEPSLVKKRA